MNDISEEYVISLLIKAKKDIGCDYLTIDQFDEWAKENDVLTWRALSKSLDNIRWNELKKQVSCLQTYNAKVEVDWDWVQELYNKGYNFTNIIEITGYPRNKIFNHEGKIKYNERAEKIREMCLWCPLDKMECKEDPYECYKIAEENKFFDTEDLEVDF